MYEEQKAAGIIPIPGKLLSRLHAIELENNVYQTKFNANNAQAGALIETYLEEACGVDTDAEKWVPEVDKRRFRREDLRPPELRPENEIRPTEQEVSAPPSTPEPTPLAPRRVRRAQKGIAKA